MLFSGFRAACLPACLPAFEHLCISTQLLAQLVCGLLISLVHCVLIRVFWRVVLRPSSQVRHSTLARDTEPSSTNRFVRREEILIFVACRHMVYVVDG